MPRWHAWFPRFVVVTFLRNTSADRRFREAKSNFSLVRALVTPSQTIFTARIPAVWTNNPFLPSLKLPDDWPETGIVTRGLLLPARPGDGSSRQLDFPIRKKDFPIRALIFLQIGRIPERRFRFLLYLFGLLLILLLKFRRRKEEF